jgi:hypothetical protein
MDNRYDKKHLYEIRKICSTLAHDIKSPMLASSFSVTAIEKYLPSFIEAYDLARSNQLIPDLIPPDKLNLLRDICDRMEEDMISINTIVDTFWHDIKTRIPAPPETD